MSSSQCQSIKSRKKREEQCPNLAKNGEFCGIHAKTGVRWVSPENYKLPCKKIQGWYRLRKSLRNIYFRGPAFYDRTLCVNSEDFFSTDPVKDIPATHFYSFRDLSDSLVYGFDARSFNMLVDKSREKNEVPKNPYTRNPIGKSILDRFALMAKWLKDRRLELCWVATAPITPDQAWGMKVVEVFVTMEELQYGADPEWFISLNLQKQKEFYLQLLDIWTHRAGLSQTDRERIVPTTTQLFHWSISRIAGIQQLSTIRSTNLHIMKKLVSSAVDRSDHVLGAMYILTALTQVSTSAADAFPWLYESAVDQHVQQQIAWVHNILAGYVAQIQQM